MQLSRRHIIAAGLLAALPASVLAQDPKPLTLVVPAPAGGGLDSLARLVALHLGRTTGEPVVVENRPGANTNIGSEHVARAAPDGRTLLVTGVSLAINELMFKMNFAPLRDLQPVIQLSNEYAVLVVPANSPIGSIADLERVARGKASGLNCGAPPGHMLLACQQLAARFPSVTIPFAGVAPAVNAALGGHVDMLFVSPELAVRPHVQAGKLRIIAVSDDLRAQPGLKDIPGFRQAWPGFVSTTFAGIWAPAGTPAAAVAKLNRDLNGVLQEPEVRERMADANQPVVGGTPEAFMRAARKAQDEFRGKAQDEFRAVVNHVGLAVQ
jgi:tripartite-type tricarboxylate transporter receptor subunit TctC